MNFQGLSFLFCTFFSASVWFKYACSVVPFMLLGIICTERFWLQNILGFRAGIQMALKFVDTVIMMKCSSIDLFSKSYMPLQSYCSPLLKFFSKVKSEQGKRVVVGHFESSFFNLQKILKLLNHCHIPLETIRTTKISDANVKIVRSSNEGHCI